MATREERGGRERRVMERRQERRNRGERKGGKGRGRKGGREEGQERRKVMFYMCYLQPQPLKPPALLH